MGSLPDCPCSKCLSATHQRIDRKHGALPGCRREHLWPMPQLPKKGLSIVSIPNIFSVYSSSKRFIEHTGTICNRFHACAHMFFHGPSDSRRAPDGLSLILGK